MNNRDVKEEELLIQYWIIKKIDIAAIA